MLKGLAVKVYRCPSDMPGVFSGEAGIAGWARINVVACWSPDGTQVEPGANYNDSPAGVFNDPTKNPSKKKALFNPYFPDDLRLSARHVRRNPGIPSDSASFLPK